MPIKRACGALTGLCFVACGTAVPNGIDHNLTSDVRWRAQAVSMSAWYLRDLCEEVAPLEIIAPENPEYQQCVKQSLSAEFAERDRMYAAALQRCIENPGSDAAACCYERVSDGRIVEKYWQDKCNTECGARTHRRPAPSGPIDCHPLVVSHPTQIPARFNTDAVKAIRAQCALNARAVEKCSSLKSLPERVVCKAACSPPSDDSDPGLDEQQP